MFYIHSRHGPGGLLLLGRWIGEPGQQVRSSWSFSAWDIRFSTHGCLLLIAVAEYPAGFTDLRGQHLGLLDCSPPERFILTSMIIVVATATVLGMLVLMFVTGLAEHPAWPLVTRRCIWEATYELLLQQVRAHVKPIHTPGRDGVVTAYAAGAP